MKSIKDLPPEERPQVGAACNKVKEKIESFILRRESELKREELARKFEEERIDFTLPGKKPLIGKKHIISQVIEEISEIFLGLGFKIVEGPEAELDYYNFTALNTPFDHPARSLQDTFYLTQPDYGKGELSLEEMKEKSKEIVLLRTHTSPVQIRVMKKEKPPLYVISPGRVFRHDVADPSHSPVFHQVEGFAVDKGISFGDLRGTLEYFVKEMFGKERKTRFRPHFFPFTEPSAEVDVSCFLCQSEGCRVCKWTGWLEMLGAGMIDPNVLLEVGIDPEEYSGYAFGMGVERIAMLKYGVTDIRLFFENDLRFLRQF